MWLEICDAREECGRYGLEVNGGQIRKHLVSPAKEFKFYSVVSTVEPLMIYKEGTGMITYDLTSL